MRRIGFILVCIFSFLIISCTPLEMATLVKLSIPEEVGYKAAARQVVEKRKGREIITNFSYYENLSLVKKFLRNEGGYEIPLGERQKAFIVVIESNPLFEKVKIFIIQPKRIRVWAGSVSTTGIIKEDPEFTSSLAKELAYFSKKHFSEK